MKRDHLNDLNFFVAVAEELSFTKAAAKLGVSQSAPSHAIRRLERHLGIRLLTRTTRNMSLTDAGEQLFKTLKTAFGTIDNKLDSLVELRENPVGSIRLNSSPHATQFFLWPRIKTFMQDYPDVKIEIINNIAFTDIITERFDAGIRLGESIDKDMISVRISPDLRMIAVASPEYINKYGQPLTPYDLTLHKCLNIRHLASGEIYVWEFEKDGKEINVRVDGNFICNDTEVNVQAALLGFGIGFVMEDIVKEHLKKGDLVQLLADWTPAFSGYHLYYPSRRQHSRAFRLLIDALRYDGR